MKIDTMFLQASLMIRKKEAGVGGDAREEQHRRPKLAIPRIGTEYGNNAGQHCTRCPEKEAIPVIREPWPIRRHQWIKPVAYSYL